MSEEQFEALIHYINMVAERIAAEAVENATFPHQADYDCEDEARARLHAELVEEHR